MQHQSSLRQASSDSEVAALQSKLRESTEEAKAAEARMKQKEKNAVKAKQQISEQLVHAENEAQLNAQKARKAEAQTKREQELDEQQVSQQLVQAKKKAEYNAQQAHVAETHMKSKEEEAVQARQQVSQQLVQAQNQAQLNEQKAQKAETQMKREEASAAHAQQQNSQQLAQAEKQAQWDEQRAQKAEAQMKSEEANAAQAWRQVSQAHEKAQQEASMAATAQAAKDQMQNEEASDNRQAEQKTQQEQQMVNKAEAAEADMKSKREDAVQAQKHTEQQLAQAETWAHQEAQVALTAQKDEAQMRSKEESLQQAQQQASTNNDIADEQSEVPQQPQSSKEAAAQQTANSQKAVEAWENWITHVVCLFVAVLLICGVWRYKSGDASVSNGLQYTNTRDLEKGLLENGGYVWDIASLCKGQNFKVGDKLLSDKFSAKGVPELRLRFYPAGDFGTVEGKSTILLEVPSGWEITAKLSLGHVSGICKGEMAYKGPGVIWGLKGDVKTPAQFTKVGVDLISATEAKGQGGIEEVDKKLMGA
eukprot:gnl/MRDRNA2_/MRDRNA2_69514_c0_seq1.p1 gnl/MRDRNA2_/MRDRNA2_69514_c0~~gnl/MRDRNA2_/MRDRNA2_69514_c0_seq1.p1  ORF type:complete len:621 (-),score=206.83 gnl/MRDRNA2_/MRDRNA2_69514_c0_seq1:91-1695(-)